MSKHAFRDNSIHHLFTGSISSNCYKKFESSMGRDNRTENNMTAGGSRGTCNPSTSYAEACQQTSQTTAVIIFLVAILVLETVLFGIALAACYLCCVKRNRSKKGKLGSDLPSLL